MKLAKLITLAIPAALFSTSCNFNIFDPIDGPGDNPDQLLSAARACFDNGDFECAAEYYGELEGTTYGEQAAAEQAFAILDQAGAGMKAFMSAVGAGSGSGGQILTTMALRIAQDGSPSASLRGTMFTAFAQIDKIPNNAALRGLVRFVTTLAIAAEILAEDIPGAADYLQSDLANNPSACKVAAGCPGAPPASCAKTGSDITFAAAPGGSPFAQTTAPSSALLNGAPTWGMFLAVLEGLDHALANEISAGGNFSGTQGFANQIITSGIGNDGCLRQLLLNNGVGN